MEENQELVDLKMIDGQERVTNPSQASVLSMSTPDSAYGTTLGKINNSFTNELKTKFVQPEAYLPFEMATNSVATQYAQKEGGNAFREYGTVSLDNDFIKLKSGKYIPKYESYIAGVDNNERMAFIQNNGAQEDRIWKRGLDRAWGTFWTTGLGGIGGLPVGVVSAINEGSLTAFYDNDFTNWLDEQAERAKYNGNQIYYSQAEQDMSLGQSMGTQKFWADKVLGGASFTVGTIGSELLWGVVTGGASVGAKAGMKALQKGLSVADKATDIARTGSVIGKLMNKVNKAIRNGFKAVTDAKALGVGTDALVSSATNASRLREGIHTVRFALTSSAYEAGFEARAMKNESEKNFLDYYTKELGRMPNQEEWNKFQEDLDKSAMTVAGLNMALLSVSNISMFGKMFGVKNPFASRSVSEGNKLTKKLFGYGVDVAEGGKKSVAKSNFLQKSLNTLWGVTKSGATEGVWEEGGQGVASGWMSNYMESTYNPEAVATTLKETSSFLSPYLKDALEEQYTTKEGHEEMVIGAIIGGLFGFGNVRSENKSDRARLAQTVEYNNTIGERRNDFINNMYSQEAVLTKVGSQARNLSAQADRSEALEKGQPVRAQLKAQESLISMLDGAYSVGKDGSFVNALLADMESMDVNKIADQYNINKEGAVTFIAENMKAVQDTADRYEKARELAEQIASQLGDDVDRQKVVQGLSYALTTRGNVAEVIQEASIKLKSLFENNGQTKRGRIAELGVLQSLADESANKELVNLKNEHNNLIEERERLTEELRDVQGEDAETRVTRQKVIQDRLVEVENAIANNNERGETMIASISEPIFGATGETYSYNEMLDLFKEDAQDLEEIIEAQKTKNPQLYLEMKDAFDVINEGGEIFKSFDNVLKDFSGKDVKFSNNSNFLKKLFKKEDVSQTEKTKKVIEDLGKINLKISDAPVVEEDILSDVEAVDDTIVEQEDISPIIEIEKQREKEIAKKGEATKPIEIESSEEGVDIEEFAKKHGIEKYLERVYKEFRDSKLLIKVNNEINSNSKYVVGGEYNADIFFGENGTNVKHIIYVNEKDAINKEMLAYIILHEFIHFKITLNKRTNSLKESQEFDKRMESFSKDVLDKIDYTQVSEEDRQHVKMITGYIKRSPEELFTYALTDSVFANILKNSKGVSNKKSLWENLIDKIKEFVGIDGNLYNDVAEFLEKEGVIFNKNEESVVEPVVEQETSSENKGVQQLTEAEIREEIKALESSNEETNNVDFYKTFVERLSNRFNVNVKWSEQYDQKGWYDPSTNTAYLNPKLFDGSTAVHEIFGHPFLNKIKTENTELYDNLLKEVGKNKAITEHVDGLYPQEQRNDEYILRALDLSINNELSKVKPSLGLLRSINSLVKQLSEFVKDLLGITSVEDFSPKTSIEELAQMAFYGKNKLDLAPTKFDGKQETLFQLSPEISQDYFNRNADRLPLTLAVFERSEFKKLHGKMVNLITIKNSLNQQGIKQIEKDLINNLIDKEFANEKKVSYDELEMRVRASIMPLEKLRTSSYADYGVDKLGGSYGETETIIFNSPVNHGIKGHFSKDFTRDSRENLKYSLKQLDESTWVAVEDGYETSATQENIMNFVGTAGSKESVEKWISERQTSEFKEGDEVLYGDTLKPSVGTFAMRLSSNSIGVLNESGEVVEVENVNIINSKNKHFLNKGLFSHARVWKKGSEFYVPEIQSDFFQKENAKKTFIERTKEFLVYEDNFNKNVSEAWENVVKDLEKKGYLLVGENSVYKIVNYGENYTKDDIVEDGVFFSVGNSSFLTYEKALDYVSSGNIDLMSTLDGEELSLDNELFKEEYEEYLKSYKEAKKLFDKNLDSINLTKEEKQFISSQKEWKRRTLREVLKEASLNGSKTLRIPTPNTLAQIEWREGVNTQTEGLGLSTSEILPKQTLFESKDYAPILKGQSDLIEILRSERGANVSLISDENGWQWYETEITEEDKQKPVIAFQLTPEQKQQRLQALKDELARRKQAIEQVHEKYDNLYLELVSQGRISRETALREMERFNRTDSQAYKALQAEMENVILEEQELTEASKREKLVEKKAEEVKKYFNIDIANVTLPTPQEIDRLVELKAKASLTEEEKAEKETLGDKMLAFNVTNNTYVEDGVSLLDVINLRAQYKKMKNTTLNEKKEISSEEVFNNDMDALKEEESRLKGADGIKRFYNISQVTEDVYINFNQKDSSNKVTKNVGVSHLSLSDLMSMVKTLHPEAIITTPQGEDVTEEDLQRFNGKANASLYVSLEGSVVEFHIPRQSSQDPDGVDSGRPVTMIYNEDGFASPEYQLSYLTGINTKTDSTIRTNFTLAYTTDGSGNESVLKGSVDFDIDENSGYYYSPIEASKLKEGDPLEAVMTLTDGYNRRLHNTTAKEEQINAREKQKATVANLEAQKRMYLDSISIGMIVDEVINTLNNPSTTKAKREEILVKIFGSNPKERDDYNKEKSSIEIFIKEGSNAEGRKSLRPKINMGAKNIKRFYEFVATDEVLSEAGKKLKKIGGKKGKFYDRKTGEILTEAQADKIMFDEAVAKKWKALKEPNLLEIYSKKSEEEIRKALNKKPKLIENKYFIYTPFQKKLNRFAERIREEGAELTRLNELIADTRILANDSIEFQRKANVYLVIPGTNKAVGRLKASYEKASLSDSAKEIIAVRSFLSSQLSDKQIEARVPVSVDYTFVGTPIHNFKDGAPVMQNVVESDVENFGYIENGTIFANKDNEDFEAPFIKNISKKNVDVKIPFVVFKDKVSGKNIAYPVTLNNATGSVVYDKVNDILNGKLSKGKKVNAINEVLMNARISSFIDIESLDSPEQIQAMLDHVLEQEVPISVEEFKEEFPSEAGVVQTPLNFKQQAFATPKLVINLNVPQAMRHLETLKQKGINYFKEEVSTKAKEEAEQKCRKTFK